MLGRSTHTCRTGTAEPPRRTDRISRLMNALDGGSIQRSDPIPRICTATMTMGMNLVNRLRRCRKSDLLPAADAAMTIDSVGTDSGAEAASRSPFRIIRSLRRKNRPITAIHREAKGDCQLATGTLRSGSTPNLTPDG